MTQRISKEFIAAATFALSVSSQSLAKISNDDIKTREAVEEVNGFEKWNRKILDLLQLDSGNRKSYNEYLRNDSDTDANTYEPSELF